MQSAAEQKTVMTGRKVLLVEDEALVALLLEDMLQELGLELAGSAASINDALKLAESAEADVAVLDINVGGREVFPVAEQLAARNIPIVFSSGYDADSLPEEWQSRPLVRKPCLLVHLETALGQAMNQTGAAGAAARD